MLGAPCHKCTGEVQMMLTLWQWKLWKLHYHYSSGASSGFSVSGSSSSGSGFSFFFLSSSSSSSGCSGSPGIGLGIGVSNFSNSGKMSGRLLGCGVSHSCSTTGTIFGVGQVEDGSECELSPLSTKCNAKTNMSGNGEFGG